MQTVYDWVTLAIFAGLAVLFLQRSTDPDASDSLIPYVGAGVGCAVANYLGNHDQQIAAILLIVATVAFVLFYLKPFNFGPKA